MKMTKELIHSVSESLIRLRFAAVNQFLKPMREKERETCEFPPGYIHVLGLLKPGGKPVSMTDLANTSHISKPNLTTMVDRFCAEGLVERSADINDRRIVNVTLTQKGRDCLMHHKAEVAAFVASRLALLQDTELEKLKDALDDITEIFNLLTERQKEHR